MGIQVVRTAVEIEPDIALLDIKTIRRGRRLLEFVVHFRILVDDVWVVVVRYDNCHGVVHVHRCWLSAESEVQPWPPEPGQSIAAALRAAEAGLDREWNSFRELMFDKIRQLSCSATTSGLMP